MRAPIQLPPTLMARTPQGSQARTAQVDEMLKTSQARTFADIPSEHKLPPAPLSPAPAPTVTDPPAPPEALPVSIDSAPELLPADPPVLTLTSPLLLPAPLALAEPTATLPLELDELTPLVTLTLPPLRLPP